MSLSKLKNAKNVNVIFLSATDHNEKEDNHGLFQMFKFFLDEVKVKSIFVTTNDSMSKDGEKVFDIGRVIGGDSTLFGRICPLFKEKELRTQDSWRKEAKSIEDFYDRAADVIIGLLPEHKFIAIADKNDIDYNILERVMNHFNSKVIILSATNSTWTGYCAYPEAFMCDKYKTTAGCSSDCPAIKEKKDINPDSIAEDFDRTRNFVNRNFDSIYLNVGNSYSLQEANESFLFKDVKKILIPLKNLTVEGEFEELWEYKQRNRNELFKQLGKANIPDTHFIMMWSAYRMTEYRKGMSYFINIINILKHLMKDDTLSGLCLVVATKPDPEYLSIIQKTGVTCMSGFLDRDEYNCTLAGSDIYCSTTIAEAGPRTNYESAAVATPVISFDKCNAADFINENNGALVDTFDVKKYAEEIYRFIKLTPEQKKEASYNMYKTYKQKMDSKKLAHKWEQFFKECEDEV
jgi:hypothetical protein